MILHLLVFTLIFINSKGLLSIFRLIFERVQDFLGFFGKHCEFGGEVIELIILHFDLVQEVTVINLCQEHGFQLFNRLFLCLLDV